MTPASSFFARIPHFQPCSDSRNEDEESDGDEESVVLTLTPPKRPSTPFFEGSRLETPSIETPSIHRNPASQVDFHQLYRVKETSPCAIVGRLTPLEEVSLPNLIKFIECEATKSFKESFSEEYLKKQKENGYDVQREFNSFLKEIGRKLNRFFEKAAFQDEFYTDMDNLCDELDCFNGSTHLLYDYSSFFALAFGEEQDTEEGVTLSKTPEFERVKHEVNTGVWSPDCSDIRQFTSFPRFKKEDFQQIMWFLEELLTSDEVKGRLPFFDPKVRFSPFSEYQEEIGSVHRVWTNLSTRFECSDGIFRRNPKDPLSVNKMRSNILEMQTPRVSKVLLDCTINQYLKQELRELQGKWVRPIWLQVLKEFGIDLFSKKEEGIEREEGQEFFIQTYIQHVRNQCGLDTESMLRLGKESLLQELSRLIAIVPNSESIESSACENEFETLKEALQKALKDWNQEETSPVSREGYILKKLNFRREKQPGVYKAKIPLEMPHFKISLYELRSIEVFVELFFSARQIREAFEKAPVGSRLEMPFLSSAHTIEEVVSLWNQTPEGKAWFATELQKMESVKALFFKRYKENIGAEEESLSFEAFIRASR